MGRSLSFFIFLLLNLENVISDENLLCSEKFCQRYLDQKKCLVLGAACQVQNSTYNGEIFPGAVPCNCCKVCLEHLSEGDFCTIGSPDAAPPPFVCGPGLYCTNKENKEEYRCQKMDNTPCFKDQIKYDKLGEKNAWAFMQRPNCDGDGNYSPVKCNIGQTCFCVDEKGARIFGESVHNEITELTMKCECSRLHAKISKWSWLNHPILVSRCLEDGSFDPMQCIDNDCICVEQDTASPTTKNYNISEIKYSSLPCYNKAIHRSYTYLHDCEQIQWDLLNEMQPSDDEQFASFDIDIPKCQPDGWFLPVQEKNNMKLCVDRYGYQIDSYHVPKNSPLAATMNCNCARTQNLLKQKKISVLPECCPNGNFKKIQCRDEMCYCVDKDGLQISKEMPQSEMKLLPCYSSRNSC